MVLFGGLFVRHMIVSKAVTIDSWTPLFKRVKAHMYCLHRLHWAHAASVYDKGDELTVFYKGTRNRAEWFLIITT